MSFLLFRARTENATLFAVLRPQARAEANRAQARLLGRRLGSGGNRSEPYEKI